SCVIGWRQSRQWPGGTINSSMGSTAPGRVVELMSGKPDYITMGQEEPIILKVIIIIQVPK
ncbi:MAG: hypothetical protein ACRC4N_05505, partial [Gammaproteobacteria bacterium]